MVITVRDVVTACDTEQQGDTLRSVIISALASPGVVDLSFSGITSVTSSFVNAAFVELLAAMPFSTVKARIRISDSTRQINDLIRSRLAFEAGRSGAAA
jgi:hypothetical protein